MRRRLYWASSLRFAVGTLIAIYADSVSDGAAERVRLAGSSWPATTPFGRWALPSEANQEPQSDSAGHFLHCDIAYSTAASRLATSLEPPVNVSTSQAVDPRHNAPASFGMCSISAVRSSKLERSMGYMIPAMKRCRSDSVS
jgi:hypothetical protein